MLPRAFRLLAFASFALVLCALPLADAFAKRGGHTAPAPQVEGTAAPQLATEPVDAHAAAPTEGAADSHDAAGAEHHEEGAGGLPQLDIARFPGQLFWLSMTFIFTFVMMRFVALPKVAETIGSREDRINSDVAAAKNKNESMKRLTGEYETRLTRARSDAVTATRTVNEEAAKVTAAKLAEQATQINAKLKDAETRLTTQKNEAIAALDKETTSVVSEILLHVAGISPASAEVESAIKKAGSV